MIDELGGVTNINTGRTLKQESTINGYLRVTLSYAGETKRFLTHRLMGLVYLPNPQEMPVINHIDGVKTNNALGNLEWCSWQHNNQHAVDVLSRPSARGIEHYNAKFTDADILHIRKSRDDGESCRSIARRLKCSHQHVSDVTRMSKRVQVA